MFKKIFASCLYYYFKECGFKDTIGLRIVVADLVNITNPNVFNVITIFGYIVIIKIVNLFKLRQFFYYRY